MPNDLVKFDPSKLKEEINNQRKEMLQKNPELAKKVNNGMKGKKFISELKSSMVHGVKTEASELVRAVNQKTDNNYAPPIAVAKNYAKQQPQQRQVIQEQTVSQPQRTGASDWGVGSSSGGGNPNPSYRGSENDRESSFEQVFTQKNDAFDQMMMRGAAKNNPNLQKFLDGNPNASQFMNQSEQVVIAEQTEGTNHNVNEQLQLINDKVERNLEKMVESAFKGVLTNIYTKQKIHEALGDFLESDEFVKIVGEAIVKISKRNKAKQ